MSKQLSFSATASTLAMALLALVVSFGGMTGAPASSGPMASPLTALSN